MFDQTYTPGGSEFQLHIRSGTGDLKLHGTSETAVRVQGNAGDPQWDAGASVLTLTLDDDVTLDIPRELTVHVSGEAHDVSVENLKCRLLHIERIRGDAALESVEADVELGGVASDLAVDDLSGNLQIGGVGSDASIKTVSGNVTCRGVGSDLSVRDVKGNVTVTGVGGDARLTDIEGAVGSLSAGGDIVLRVNLQPERAMDLTAGGDVVMMLDPDVNAHIEATSGGGVTDRLTGHSTSMPGVWTCDFGQGGPAVKLRAGGEIIFKSRGDDKRGRGESHREEAMRAREDARRVREEAMRAREEALRVKQQLREQMHAQRDEIRRNVKEGFRFGGFQFGFGKHGPRPGEPPPPARSPKGASEEERLKILKMLQDKVITAEQAEMLLSALGD
jgi:hypothetical protein